MIKVLFVVDYLSMNIGGPRFLTNVFRRLPKDNYEIHIITGAVSYGALDVLQGHNNIDVINLSVFDAKALPSEQSTNVIKFLYKALNTVNRTTRRSRIDIIHLNTHFPNLLSYAIKLNLNLPIICSIHHLEETTQFYSISSKTAKLVIQDLLEINSPCNVVHVPSRYTKQRIKDLTIINKNNIIVIPPGIEIEKYLSIPRRAEENLFVMIVRLERRKHCDHAIAALKIVTRRNPDVKLFIIGDGPMKPYLMQLVKRLSLEKNVSLLGVVDEKTKLDFLSRAQALIHLGYPEGFGIAILEALASGTPVIAYDVPPINEIIRNSITGVLVEKDNLVKLAEAIININQFDFNSEILKNVAKKYDISIITRQFDTLYKYLVYQKRPNIKNKIIMT